MTNNMLVTKHRKVGKRKTTTELKEKVEKKILVFSKRK